MLVTAAYSPLPRNGSANHGQLPLFAELQKRDHEKGGNDEGIVNQTDHWNKVGDEVDGGRTVEQGKRHGDQRLVLLKSIHEPFYTAVRVAVAMVLGQCGKLKG